MVQKEDSQRTNSEMQTSAEENVPESNEVMKPRLHDKETLAEETNHLFKPGIEYQSVTSLLEQFKYFP